MTVPCGCLKDPLLDESRYVYVQAGVTSLLALARGTRRMGGGARGRIRQCVR